jgi:hypothetical protein
VVVQTSSKPDPVPTSKLFGDDDPTSRFVGVLNNVDEPLTVNCKEQVLFPWKARQKYYRSVCFLLHSSLLGARQPR